MEMKNKRYFTQWAAQFYAAAELTRRGYLVSLTLGNAPEVDLLAQSPSGHRFEVDVKGLASPNFWLVRERQHRPDLYFVLVHLPADGSAPRFFILTSKEMMDAISEIRRATEAAGKPWPKSGSGIPWKKAFDFANRWDTLPA